MEQILLFSKWDSLYVANYVQSLFMFFSIIIGIRSYIKDRLQIKMYIIIYCLISFFTTILVSYISIDNNILINNFTIFEYFFFSLLITKVLGAKKIYFSNIVLTILFSILAIKGIATKNSFLHLRTELIIIENISLTILCLSYYKNLLTQEEILDFKNDFTFWMITGALFYFCLTTPYYLCYSGLTFTFRNSLYWINAVCNLTMHCMFIKGYVCSYKSH
jgi:hypothetical protein